MLHKKKIVQIEVLTFLTACLIVVFSQTAFAVNEQTQNKIHNWQMKQIYQPSQHLLDRESHGFVNIYDGFSDTQVDQVMDQKFERIDNMMFTRVKKTDIQGAILKDPVSGLDIVEDDGCD